MGLDGSTVSTGFGVGGPQDAGPRGGVWRLPGADESVFDFTLGKLARSVMETASVTRAKIIYLEAPFAKIDREHSEHTAISLMQLAGCVRAAGNMAGCKVVLCAVFNVRKYFIGQGFLSRSEAKPRVLAKCHELGWAIANNNDDQADAYATWAYGMSQEFPGWKPNQPLLFDHGKARA